MAFDGHNSSCRYLFDGWKWEENHIASSQVLSAAGFGGGVASASFFFFPRHRLCFRFGCLFPFIDRCPLAGGGHFPSPPPPLQVCYSLSCEAFRDINHVNGLHVQFILASHMRYGCTFIHPVEVIYLHDTAPTRLLFNTYTFVLSCSRDPSNPIWISLS